MAEQSPDGGGSRDVEATLRLAFGEAVNGTTTSVTLNDGRGIRVRIPAGVTDGQRLRVSGKGREVAGVFGDLYLHLRVGEQVHESSMKCVICEEGRSPATGMSDGNVFHEECLASLQDQASRLGAEVRATTELTRELRTQLAKANTFLGSISRLFGGDSDDEIQHSLQTATAALSDAQIRHKQSQDLLTPIFDFMLRYPPDWNDRVARVRSRCSRCGSSRNLHTHHKTPLSKGGSNRIENLECLCESCHSLAHGGRSMSPSGPRANDDLPFSGRIALCREAIATGADLEFLYSKPGHSYEKRTVTPSRIKSVKHQRKRGSTLCLTGYCHTRNAERTFAFKRMKDMKLRQ